MNRFILAVCLMLALIATLPGCGEDKKPASVSAARAPDATYTVRGQITALPKPGTTISLPMIHHEAIADFKNAQGEAVGMNEMTMEFPLAADVSLEGYNVGDKVEFTFAVWWEARSGQWHITKIAKLPPETELHFAPPATPTAPATDAPAHEHGDHGAIDAEHEHSH